MGYSTGWMSRSSGEGYTAPGMPGGVSSSVSDVRISIVAVRVKFPKTVGSSQAFMMELHPARQARGITATYGGTRDPSVVRRCITVFPKPSSRFTPTRPPSHVRVIWHPAGQRASVRLPKSYRFVQDGRFRLLEGSLPRCAFLYESVMSTPNVVTGGGERHSVLPASVRPSVWEDPP